MFDFHEIRIKWLGHAGFQITKDKIIYIDPFKVEGEKDKADIILITHSHYDHCSVEDVAKLVGENTTIVATPDCISKLSNMKYKDLKTVTPGDSLEIEGVKIEVVPAYNINKQFHPKVNDWVGYIVTIGGKRIYHSGDSDATPEMGSLKVDLALMPVSGTFVMTAEEAANVVNKIMPEVAIPMHYGSIVGESGDAEKFKQACNVKVVIMDKE